MGCDIHIMLEKRMRATEGATWDAFNWHPLNPGRSYEKFSRLAGVRGDDPHIEPRGMPSDPSWGTRDADQLFISNDDSGEGYVRPATAAAWVASNSSKYVYQNNEPVWVTNPDHHSHTWLTFAEWMTAMESSLPLNGWDIEWGMLTEAARFAESNGFETRFVFWFDN